MRIVGAGPWSMPAIVDAPRKAGEDGRVGRTITVEGCPPEGGRYEGRVEGPSCADNEEESGGERGVGVVLR